METTLITDKCYACEYEKYCERYYCCLRNSRFTETIIDKTQKGEKACLAQIPQKQSPSTTKRVERRRQESKRSNYRAS